MEKHRNSGNRQFLVVVEGRASALYQPSSANGSGEQVPATIPVLDFGPGQLIVFRTLFNGTPTRFGVRAEGDVGAVAIPVPELEAYLKAELELAHEIQQIISAN